MAEYVRKNETLQDVLVLLIGAAAVVFVLAFGLGLWLFSAWLLMWAWNLVLHGLFGLPALSFLAAVGVTVLLGFIRNIFRPFIKAKSTD